MAVEPGNLLFILLDEHQRDRTGKLHFRATGGRGAILAPGDFSYTSAPGEKPVLVVERKER